MDRPGQGESQEMGVECFLLTYMSGKRLSECLSKSRICSGGKNRDIFCPTSRSTSLVIRILNKILSYLT